MSHRGPDVASTKPLLEKLGARPGFRISVLGFQDQGFVERLRERGADVSTRRRGGSDMVFLSVEDRSALTSVPRLERWLKRDGAIWVVYPRGQRHLREVDVIQAGLDAGLVDNKIVRFSDSHSALRLVIPLARR